MSGKRLFWLAVILQLLVFAGMISYHSFTLATGEPVLLKTAPFDPWDPFRGEYVRLRYEISSPEIGKVPMAGAPYKRGQTVYVTLRKGNPYWNAVAISDQKVAVAAGDVLIRGTVEWYMTDMPPAETTPAQPTDPSQPREPMPVPSPVRQVVNIRYGIEQFYVPQGEGPGLERRQPDLSVEAVVDRFGRAALRKVFIDGKEVRFE